MKLAETFGQLSENDDRNTVFGDRGHLMVFGDQALGGIQETFLALVERVRTEQGLNLFDPGRHFALDEFLFLHRLLDRMDQDGTCAWERDHFRPHIDFPYKDCVPMKEELAGQFLFSDAGAGEDNLLKDNFYVHLQKRRVEMEAGWEGHPEDGLYFVLGPDGVVSATREQSEFLPGTVGLGHRLGYFRRMYSKLLRTRLNNYALGRRPSFSEDLISGMLGGNGRIER